MPTEKSNFSRYVIPDPIDPVGDCCICVPVPDSPEYIAQFMGAIWRLGIQSHYERDDAHSGKVVAEKWRAIWLEVQTNMGCCEQSTPSVIINQEIRNTNIKILMLALRALYFDNSMDVSLAFPLAPAQFDADPGDAGPEIASRERALCLASESFVDELFNQGMSWLEVAARDSIPIASGALIIPSVPTLVVSTVGITMLVLGAAAYVQLMLPAYRKYMACAMFEKLKGEDVIDKTAFDAVFDGLPSPRPQPETPEVNVIRDLIEKWARSQVNNLDNYLAFISNLDSAMNIASTLDDTDCECSGEWQHTWLGGFNNAGDWAFVPWNPAYEDGTYNAAEDRFEGFCVEDSATAVRVEISFTEVTLTRMRVWVDHNPLRSTSGDGVDIGHAGDVDFYLHVPVPDTNDSLIADTGVISVLEDNLIVRAAAGVNACGLGAFAYITQITLDGDGANPFV